MRALQLRSSPAVAQRLRARTPSTPSSGAVVTRDTEDVARAPAPAEPAQAAGDVREAPGEELDEELDALALLERQHNEHKAAAALIRAELGL